MKTKLLIVIIALFAAQTSTVKINDLDRLVGKTWKGTLTYLDYGTNLLTPIETELMVKNSAKGAGVYDWTTIYPKETSHNSTDELVISKDGKILDGETVKKRTEANEILTIITEKEGNDNNKPATFRFTYVIGSTTFSRKKEVCYKDEQKWFTRNTLSLSAR